MTARCRLRAWPAAVGSVSISGLLTTGLPPGPGIDNAGGATDSTTHLFSTRVTAPAMSDVHERYNAIEPLIDEERYEEAAEALESLISDQDDFVLGHLALARVYTKIGKHDEAIRHGQRAVDLEPNDPFNHTALSVTYQRAWAGTGEQQYIGKAEDAMAKAHSLG